MVEIAVFPLRGVKCPPPLRLIGLIEKVFNIGINKWEACLDWETQKHKKKQQCPGWVILIVNKENEFFEKKYTKKSIDAG